MKIEIPDNLTDEQKQAIIDAIINHGGAIIDIAEVKQGLYARFVEWWYSFWRRIGFN